MDIASAKRLGCVRSWPRVAPQVVFESGQFSSLLGLVGAGMGAR